MLGLQRNFFRYRKRPSFLGQTFSFYVARFIIMIANITITTNNSNIRTTIGNFPSLNIENISTKIHTVKYPINAITPSINPKLYFPPFTELRSYRRIDRDKTYEIMQAAPNPNVHKITNNTSSPPPLYYTINFRRTQDSCSWLNLFKYS